jgi:phage repressor protein C with HTH and peptisase S24 domain
MAGVINDGDVVFVDVRVNHFQGDGLYVFNWQGRALVKRLVPSIKSGQIQIVSANPAYPAETVGIDELESLHIAGKVVAWWTLKRH